MTFRKVTGPLSEGFLEALMEMLEDGGIRAP